MELNLRKSRKLEQKIGRYLDKKTLKLTVTVRAKSELTDAVTALNLASDKLLSDLNVNIALNDLRSVIRASIGQVNSSTGVNDLMAQREGFKNRIALLEITKDANTAPDQSELQDLLIAKVKNMEVGNTNRFSDPGVTVEVNTMTSIVKNNIEVLINETTKQLESLEDQLAQKNLGTTITLTDEQVNLLQVVGLL